MWLQSPDNPSGRPLLGHETWKGTKARARKPEPGDVTCLNQLHPVLNSPTMCQAQWYLLGVHTTVSLPHNLASVLAFVPRTLRVLFHTILTTFPEGHSRPSQDAVKIVPFYV